MDRFCPACKEKLDEHKSDGVPILYTCPGCPHEEEDVNIQELEKDIKNLCGQYSEIIRRVRHDIEWCAGREDYQYSKARKIEVKKEGIVK